MAYASRPGVYVCENRDLQSVSVADVDGCLDYSDVLRKYDIHRFFHGILSEEFEL